ncbi:MAG: alkaline phosphatase family protein [Acidimicrobiales bacterium]|nr:alkaline phosphatase family protein [Acidimicrobiales bacterium]
MRDQNTGYGALVIVHGPERLAGQGLDQHQEESGDRAILTLLAGDTGAQVDLVLTWREATADRPAAYEVWSQRGMCRFLRLIGDDGGLTFETIEVVGVDPLVNLDPLALATLTDERTAAAASGFDPDDADRRFIAPEHQSYPFAHERVAQLFDSPHAPDLAVSPRDWCSGSQPGTHGGLHVRQARAPLWFSGPGIRPGRHQLAARSIDIAPTCLAALGFPLVDGADATGRTSSERGAAPDVYLARQDGRPLTEVLDDEAPRPTRLYVFLLDGMHQTELEHRLDTEPDALPNLRRLRERAAVVGGGSIVNFPSITWPSHTAIGTGTWCGHHDVVNPSYYVRADRETVSPQGLQIGTERFANTAVESIYEAFHRRFPDDTTAAIHAPFGRSARHAVLEGRNLCDRAMVKALTAELSVDMNPRWAAEHPGVASEALLDTRGLAQVLELFGRTDDAPPRLVYHELALTDGAGHEYGPHSEGLRQALDETDRRIGAVLALLDERGLTDETLFVVSADHGMAPQAVELHANPTARVLDAGLQAVIAEPMIWLLDVAVEVERAADGRTGRVGVFELDTDRTGERPPVAGAEVIVEAHLPGNAPRLVARGRTDGNGLYGFATPSDVPIEHLVVAVHASGFNPRHVRLDGRALGIDLRAELYGSAAPRPAP